MRDASAGSPRPCAARSDGNCGAGSSMGAARSIGAGRSPRAAYSGAGSAGRRSNAGRGGGSDRAGFGFGALCESLRAAGPARPQVPCVGGHVHRAGRGAAFSCRACRLQPRRRLRRSARMNLRRLPSIRHPESLPTPAASARCKDRALLPIPWPLPRDLRMRPLMNAQSKMKFVRGRSPRPMRRAVQFPAARVPLRPSSSSRRDGTAARRSCTTSRPRRCARPSLRPHQVPTPPSRRACVDRVRRVLPALRGYSSPCGYALEFAANQPCRSIVTASRVIGQSTLRPRRE